MEFANIEQAEFWASMAPTWIEMDERLERTAGEPGRMAMDLLKVEHGQRIMDLGCGTGKTTVELAAQVGTDGSGMAVISVTGTPPPTSEPGAPGPFSLSDTDRVRTILADAGFDGVAVTAHNDVLASNEDQIPDYATTSIQVGAAREALKNVDDSARQKAHAAVVDALRGKAEHGEFRLTRGFQVITAHV